MAALPALVDGVDVAAMPVPALAALSRVLRYWWIGIGSMNTI